MKTLAPRRARTLEDFAHYGFDGGINIQDSPQEIPDKDLTQAVNVYLETNGDVSIRRGMVAKGPLIAGVGKGIYRFYQEVVAGAPASVAVTVAHIGDSLYNADTGALISTLGGMGTGSLPMSFARVFDPQRAGGTDILIICTGVGGPYAYDGATFYTFNSTGTTITGARWCQLVSGVLFFSGIPGQPNLVAGSALGVPESLPGYATFAMSYPVTGLGTIGVGLQTNLVVGMQQGLTLITGVNPLTYVEQEIPDEDGVVSGRSMVTVDGILYFLGEYAYYRYDGAQFTEISRKVRPWFRNDPLSQDYAMNGVRSTSWAYYYARRIYLFYSSNNLNGPPNVGLVYDLITGGWTIYAGVALNGMALVNAPGDPDPSTCVVIDASKGQQYTFDVYADAKFNISDAGAVVAASFQSKYFKIGDFGAKKTLLRLMIETIFYGQLEFVAVNILADYSTTPTLLPLTLAPPFASQFDSAIFDSSTFAGTNTGYQDTRFDVNMQAEAFSFGLQAPSPLSTSVASQPWKVMGFTGRISQQPKT
ncbi:MAG: hypothetical protein WCD38_11845 [Candidatus Tumulicola sp.]